MQIKEFNVFPRFTEEQIQIDFEETWEFLKLVHGPTLDKDLNKEFNLKGNGIELAIEIRPLRSDKGMGNRFYGTHYIYRFDEKEKERFFKFYRNIAKTKKRRGVDEYYNVPFCLYYGVYAVDLNTPAITQRGTIGKVKLATNSAHCTSVLAVDLDGINKEQFLEYKKLFDRVGIKTVVKFTGHGYQLYVLLDRPTTDLTAIKQFFNLCKYELGIKEADDKVIDPARVLRAGGYNSKGVLMKDNYHGTPVIRTETIEVTTERYNIEDVFNRFGVTYVPNKRKLNQCRWREGMFNKYGKVENYPFWDEHVGYLSKDTQKALKDFKKKQQIVNGLKEAAKNNGKTSELSQLSLKSIYPELDIDKLPEGVKNMLYGFREGHADNMLFYLTIKLKYAGYDIETVVKTILMLSTLDTFNYDWNQPTFIEGKVRGIYKSHYKNAKKEDYEKLEEEFGDLEVDYSELMNVVKSTKIKIQRSLFTTQRIQYGHEEIFIPPLVSKISPSAFRLWLVMTLENETCKIKHNKKALFTIDDIAKSLGKSTKRTRDAVESLKHIGLVDKKSSVDKKEKVKYQYFINQSIDWGKGYVLIDNSLIIALTSLVKLKELSERALMVYFYMRFRIGEDENITISQEEIGTVLNLDIRTIRRIMKELETQGLLIISSNGPRKMNDYTIRA